MAFDERKFEEKDYQEYKRLLGAGDSVRLPYPYHWMVDGDRGIQILELGGRGEMPDIVGRNGIAPDLRYWHNPRWANFALSRFICLPKIGK